MAAIVAMAVSSLATTSEDFSICDTSPSAITLPRDAKNSRIELSEQYAFFTSIKSIIDQDVYYDVAGKKWTPVALATEILKGLKHEIKRKGVEADSVVMAVPVGFSTKKKMKLREAAQNAGLKIETFISEPTAALVSNYDKMRMFRNVAVFDWGGGTLDVSIFTYRIRSR